MLTPAEPALEQNAPGVTSAPAAAGVVGGGAAGAAWVVIGAATGAACVVDAGGDRAWVVLAAAAATVVDEAAVEVVAAASVVGVEAAVLNEVTDAEEELGGVAVEAFLRAEHEAVTSATDADARSILRSRA